MNKIQKSVKHIETIHSIIYNKTGLVSLRAGKKSLLKTYKRQQKTLKEDIKLTQAQIRAYDRVIGKLESTG